MSLYTDNAADSIREIFTEFGETVTYTPDAAAGGVTRTLTVAWWHREKRPQADKRQGQRMQNVAEISVMRDPNDSEFGGIDPDGVTFDADTITADGVVFPIREMTEANMVVGRFKLGREPLTERTHGDYRKQ